MPTIYRMHTPDDIDNLVKYWCENSDWDQIDRREWERRFYSTPYGAASVAIAENNDTKEILGQIVFIPTQINVDGKAVKSYRPYALVIKKTFRSTLRFLSLMEVVRKMYNHATAHFKSTGTGLIHMMPDPRWVRAFKFLSNVQTGSFPLFTLPIPLDQKFDIHSDYTVKSITSTDEQINSLWTKNSKLYGCSLQRDAKTLSWKTSHGDYRLIGVYIQDELVALSASIVKEKDKQWLICDMMSADSGESLSTILKATCNAAHDYFTSHKTDIHKVSILATPLLETKIENLGFQKDNYKFPIVVQILDSNITKTNVSPERWYASAND